MYPNNLFSFGGYGGGGWTPPFPLGSPPSGGSYGTAPWWFDAAIYVANESGVFDWLQGQLGVGDGSQTGVVPYTGGGSVVPTMPSNFVSQYLNPLLAPGTGDNRQRVLQAYQDNPDVISRFLDWLRTLGAVGSLLTQMATSTIFEWPLILQDLILLFYHDETQALEIGPVVVGEANKSAGSSTTLPGGYMGALQHYKPPVLAATPKMTFQAPSGYVTVTDPMTGQKAFMVKELARAAGLYKPRAKAPIKASEWKAARKAQSIEKKLARMLGGSCNFKVTKKR